MAKVFGKKDIPPRQIELSLFVGIARFISFL